METDHGDMVQVEAQTCCDAYTGTKAALMAKGVARPEWFPGDPGCPRKHTFRTPDKRIVVQRASKGKYVVRIDVPSDEFKRRRQLRDSREAAEQAQRKLAALPVSAEDYRWRLKRAMVKIFGLYRALLEEGMGGYTLGKSALDEIEDAEAEIFGAVHSAPINFSAAERKREEREIVGEAIPGDPRFRAFMDGLLAAPPEDAQE